MANGTINIKLIISADRIGIEDIADFRVGIDMYNASEEEQCVDISNIELLVNRQRSYAWDLAVQNGTIINMRIPAGKHKSVMWPLGKALFLESGDYKLKLVWGDFTEEKNILVMEAD